MIVSASLSVEPKRSFLQKIKRFTIHQWQVLSSFLRLAGTDNISDQNSYHQLLANLENKLPKRYTHISFHEEGGMGVIFKAFDQETSRYVAIKTLLPQLTQDQDAIRAFLRECYTLQMIPQHPNIVTVHETVHNQNLFYYVMEFLDGLTLADLIERCKILPTRQVVWIGTQVGRALQHIHRYGLIHQDIKPENIFITRSGVSKILDFGTVRKMSSGPHHKYDNAGSPLFSSPEKLRGDAVCDKTDIYALGVCAFYMLTGQLPYQSADVLTRMLEQPACPSSLNPEIPAELERIIQQSLHPDPGQRVSSKVWSGEISVDSYLSEARLDPLLN